MVDDISAGRILWVELSPRGQGKKRPAVALATPDHDNYIYIVVGSASGEPSDPSRAFELPWDPQGHCRTKLRKRTVLDLGWRERISVDDVIRVGGILPGPALAALQEQIRTIAALISKPK